LRYGYDFSLVAEAQSSRRYGLHTEAENFEIFLLKLRGLMLSDALF